MSPSTSRLTLTECRFGISGVIVRFARLTLWPSTLRAPNTMYSLAGGEIIGERMPHVIVETQSVAVERRCATLLAGAGYRSIAVEPPWVTDNRPAEHNRWLVAPGQDG
jgi:hypothetical protein